jgi:hypothetical protein
VPVSFAKITPHGVRLAGNNAKIFLVQISSEQIDKENCLIGFFNNPKRFNVTVTRAKALLVVFGHPALLKGDPNWRVLVCVHAADIRAMTCSQIKGP